MPLHLTHQMEQFSRAYVHAVASAAGFNVFPPAEIDDDSVDLTIGDKGPRGIVRSPRIDLQLKCEQGEPSVADPLPFVLKKLKNYDDLRQADYMVPRILVLLYVPDNSSAWIVHSETELALRRCAWWVSLRGEPETKNTSAITVYIPRANVFNVETLGAMMDRIAAGDQP